jgi:hypothetical protein
MEIKKEKEKNKVMLMLIYTVKKIVLNNRELFALKVSYCTT